MKTIILIVKFQKWTGGGGILTAEGQGDFFAAAEGIFVVQCLFKIYND